MGGSAHGDYYYLKYVSIYIEIISSVSTMNISITYRLFCIHYEFKQVVFTTIFNILRLLCLSKHLIMIKNCVFNL